MDVVERLAKKYGFDCVIETDVGYELIHVDMLYRSPTDTDNKVLNNVVVHKAFRKFLNDLVDKYPQLEMGVKALIAHEKGHIPLRKGFPDVLKLFWKSGNYLPGEVFANLYQVSLSDDPIKAIAAYKYLFYVWGRLTYPEDCSSDSQIKSDLEKRWPFSTKKVHNKIFAQYKEFMNNLKF